jgi:hypothetical protein
LVGHGPNTRTIMQFRVAGTPAATYNLAALSNALPTAFAASQPTPLVPEVAYGAVSNHYSEIFDNSLTFTPIGSTNSTTVEFQPKAIQELFDPYGRMNATLGVEIPRTTLTTQTTIPYGYIDPPTETFSAGETQLWKITHNGVDTHAIHFHLFNVQLINRVGWDGMIKPPDANELGWKETIKMNPLEDIIVALHPTAPTLPFVVPDSIRPLDPTMPLGSTAGFTGIDPLGNSVTVSNILVNFGWEYVWHCHLLGHEENDMMRPMIMTGVYVPTVTAAVSPTPNAAGWNKTNVTVTITAVDYTGGPGIAAIIYSATGAQPITTTTVHSNTTSFVISTEGITTITYYATDNTNSTSAIQTVTVKLDKTLPTLTWGTVPPANAAGWHNAAVMISYTAADSLSGVASATPVSPVVISTQGSNQTQAVTVTDVAGNSKTFTSPAVKIDLTAPTITAATSPGSVNRNNGRGGPRGGGSTISVTVSGRVTDSLSGVNTRSGAYSIVDSAGTAIPGRTYTIASNGTYSFRVSLSTANTNPRGVPRTYTITVNASDNAGNTASAVTTFVVQ